MNLECAGRSDADWSASVSLALLVTRGPASETLALQSDR